MTHKVVSDLVVDVQRKEHIISMDKYITFVGLFEVLASIKIYAIDIGRSNQIGLPLTLKIRGTFKNVLQGTLEWKMYQTRKMASILWKDKKPILLLFTHAIPIGYLCMPVSTVLRRNSAV